MIHADAEEPGAYGGPGDDQIQVSGNQVLGHGEPRGRHVEGPFQGAVATASGVRRERHDHPESGNPVAARSTAAGARTVCWA